jgi:hypothetical protein
MELSKSIELPFTPDSVLRVLAYGADPESSHFSHAQIVDWCDRFWCQYLDVISEPAIEALLPILADVESESSRHETVPAQWFREWLCLAETRLGRHIAGKPD